MRARDTLHIGRRRLLQGTLASAVCAPFVAMGAHRAYADSPRTYSTHAIDIVKKSLVIDMLAPLTLDFRPESYAKPLSEKAKRDFLASGVTGFHNSVGIGGPNAHEDVTAFIAQWSGFAGRNADVFSLVDTAKDFDKAKSQGKIAVLMGVQDSDHFREVKDVEAFYQLGQRVSQLTYNTQNLLGSGCTDRVDGGLSDYGVEIIGAMEKVGMLVDTSHCGPRTTLDAIEAAKGPIAITHSNCRALNNHPRLKTDEAIIKLAKKGGVMGITEVRQFVSATEPTTVENIVDHVDHVVKLVGIEHVGYGSDSDLYGYDGMQADQKAALKASYKKSYAFRDKLDTDAFDQPLRIFDLADALIRRGYSDAAIEVVLGGNFRRLLGSTFK
jgi:membrane dipeptidase